MNPSGFSIRHEQAADASLVDALVWRVFGPGMTVRAAHALREGVAHDADLAFVAESDGALVGTVRLTPILIGDAPVWMLGPLAVEREQNNRGIGRALMQRAVEAAADKASADEGKTGPQAIMLVGDLAYYQPFGFEAAKAGTIQMPRPTDPARILLHRLTGQGDISGAARRFRA